jgi:hypothetical protein
MEGMSLGGELVLVSACLTVTPPITGGQEHTHHHSHSSIFFPSQPVTNISFPHRHPDDCHCSLHLHRKKSPRQKEEGQRSHAGKGDGVFKSAFRHDSLLTASSGLWAPHSNRCGGIDTKPQAHVQSWQWCTQTKHKEQGYLVMPAALLDLTRCGQ